MRSYSVFEGVACLQQKVLDDGPALTHAERTIIETLEKVRASRDASFRRMNWREAFGYNTRSKVEAGISRCKRVISEL